MFFILLWANHELWLCWRREINTFQQVACMLFSNWYWSGEDVEDLLTKSLENFLLLRLRKMIQARCILKKLVVVHIIPYFLIWLKRRDVPCQCQKKVDSDYWWSFERSSYGGIDSWREYLNYDHEDVVVRFTMNGRNEIVLIKVGICKVIKSVMPNSLQ